MAYGSTRDFVDVMGKSLVHHYTVTDVQTSGANTIATGMRRIKGVAFVNKTRGAAGGLKVAVSGGTLTLTAETADDDFLITVWGQR